MRYKRIWAREYGVQYAECAIKSLGPEVEDYLPAPIEHTLMLPEQGNEVFCANEGEYNLVIDKIGKMRNSKDLKKFAFSFHRYGKKYVKFAKLISYDKLKKMNDKELIDFYLQYCRMWDEYTALLWTGYYLADLYAEKGQKLIKDLGIELNGRESEALFSPSKRTGVLELKDVLIEFKKKGAEKLDSQLLRKITKEYAWVPCLDYINNPWEEKDLEEFYNHLEIADVGLSFGEVANKFKLDSESREFLKQVKEAAYLKDQRDVYRRMGVYYSIKLFEEIARRLKLTIKEAAHLTRSEIIGSLDGKLKVDLNEIRRRMKGFLIYPENGEIMVSSDPIFIGNFMRENIDKEEHKEIKGIIANKGIVKGRARIVLLVSDLKKVQKGDIMVSITTHPDFISAMQKASAFVTDEGGLMCHAAIVSREMNKPCIVGTKSATRLIKDDDVIEVDADKGIVRIIK